VHLLAHNFAVIGGTGDVGAAISNIIRTDRRRSALH
jgi:hypothetical protein